MTCPWNVPVPRRNARSGLLGLLRIKKGVVGARVPATSNTLAGGLQAGGVAAARAVPGPVTATANASARRAVTACDFISLLLLECALSGRRMRPQFAPVREPHRVVAACPGCHSWITHDKLPRPVEMRDIVERTHRKVCDDAP